jgi:hypothetical protein
MIDATLISRRRFHRLLSAAARWIGVQPMAWGAVAPAALQVDRVLAPYAPLAAAEPHLARYRADAVIVLLAVPVYRRAGVGGGRLTWQQIPGRHGRCTTIEFAAGSIPQRAGGLNRLGLLREALVDTDARRTLGTAGPRDLFYTAIDGHNRPGHSRSAVTRFVVPAGFEWQQAEQLLSAARTALAEGPADRRESQWSPREAPLTFLHAVALGLTDRASRTEQAYLYRERRYEMTLDKTPDPAQGHRFAARGLARNAECVQRVRGRTRHRESGRTTTFQIWVESRPDAPPLPLRVELQPKPFLRLVFEQEAG